MSVLDHDVLQAIGAKPTGLRSAIPLYMREKLVRELLPGGQAVTRTVKLDISFQQLAALVLEIPDYARLRRYDIKQI